jgi:hypothetical protein
MRLAAADGGGYGLSRRYVMRAVMRGGCGWLRRGCGITAARAAAANGCMAGGFRSCC